MFLTFSPYFKMYGNTSSFLIFEELLLVSIIRFITNYFHRYTQYVSNHDAATELLKKLKMQAVISQYYEVHKIILIEISQNITSLSNNKRVSKIWFLTRFFRSFKITWVVARPIRKWRASLIPSTPFLSNLSSACICCLGFFLSWWWAWQILYFQYCVIYYATTIAKSLCG